MHRKCALAGRLSKGHDKAMCLHFKQSGGCALQSGNVWKYTFECSLNTLHKSMYFKFALAHIGRKDTLVYVCLFVCQFVCPFLTVLCLCLFVSLFVCQLFRLFVVCCTYPVCARLLQGRGLQVSLFVCIPHHTSVRKGTPCVSPIV